jgi:hypothetical protein
MSRRRTQMKSSKPSKPPAPAARPAAPNKKDGAAIKPTSPRRIVPVGLPLVGSEVLEAIGSNAKVRRAMHDVIHTPDDEKMVTRLGPEQEASVAFHPDHLLGDAGAEFAEDFGRDFLLAATTGADIGELEGASTTEPSEVGGPFLQEAAVADALDDIDEGDLADEPDAAMGR